MPQPISDYIAKQEPQQKAVLQKIRQLIKEVLPNAEERMSYGVPSFRQDKKSFLYAAFKHHIGIYPEPEIIAHFQKDLTGYETAKGTIKFKLTEPIPYDLIKKMVRFKYTDTY